MSAPSQLTRCRCGLADPSTPVTIVSRLPVPALRRDVADAQADRACSTTRFMVFTGSFKHVSRPVIVAAMIVTQAGCIRMSQADVVVGEYALVSVNGKPLPFRTFAGKYGQQDLVGGTLTLTADGAAKFVTNMRNTSPGRTIPQVDSIAGRYVYGNGSLEIRLPISPFPEEQDTVAVSVERDGHELTVHFDGRADIFRFFTYKRKPS